MIRNAIELKRTSNQHTGSFAANAAWQVREEGGVYSADGAVAPGRAAHLRKAERLLDEARNLVALLLASLGDEADARAMQTEIALKLIEKKLSKVHTQIDRYDVRHRTPSAARSDPDDRVSRSRY